MTIKSLNLLTWPAPRSALAAMSQPMPAFAAAGEINEAMAPSKLEEAKIHFPPNFSAKVPPMSWVARLP